MATPRARREANAGRSPRLACAARWGYADERRSQSRPPLPAARSEAVVWSPALAVALAVAPHRRGHHAVGAPAPQPAAAPDRQFSSARAMDAAARRRRRAASHRVAAPRRACGDFIYGRLRELALDPHVQTRRGRLAAQARVAAVVHNVVGRLPGRDPSRAVLLVAHYDSVPTAAGAADNGMGVAALLETARALRAGPPPRNDVIFLFTDGEERGLLGSQAFLQHDPWAYAAGVVAQLRQSRLVVAGADVRDEPGQRPAGPQYLAAGRAYGSSLMYEVSRRQPIVTDFRPFVARGIPGMTLRRCWTARPTTTPATTRSPRFDRGGPAARGGDRPGRWRGASATPTSGSCTARRRLLRRRRQRRGRRTRGPASRRSSALGAGARSPPRSPIAGAPPPAHAARRGLALLGAGQRHLARRRAAASSPSSGRMYRTRLRGARVDGAPGS